MINQNSLENNYPNKNIIGVVVLIVVLVVGGYFVFRNPGSKELKPQETILKNVVTPEVVRISADKLQKEMPIGFPKEMPLNGKIKTLESYNASYTQNPNIKQATTKFNSSKTMEENYDFYLKWAKESNWEIKNNPIQDNLSSIYGQKNQAILNIAIIPKISDIIKSEVNITYGEM